MSPSLRAVSRPLPAAATRLPFLPLFPILGLLLLIAAPGVWARKVPVRTMAELTAAVQAAQPLDTLLLEEGTYATTRPIQIDGKSDLTLASRTGDASRTVLQGRGFASMVETDDILRIGSSKRVTVENLGFQECHGYGIKLEAEKNPEDIVIRNCRFTDIGTRHIKGSLLPGARALRGEITGCQFRNTKLRGADWPSGRDYIAAIDVMGLDGWRIARNTIVDVKGLTGGGRAGIFVWVSSRNVVVERNLIVGCDRGIAFGNPSPSSIGAELHVTNSICRNNFIVTGKDAGIELAWVDGVKVLHNSIWHANLDGRGIRSVERVTGALYANNLVRGRLLALGTETLQGNVFAALDGVFRNPQAGDLHLQSGASVALDKGAAVPEAAEDYDGDRRPQGGMPDVGADEFMAPVSVAPAPDTSGTTAPAPGKKRRGQKTLDLLGRIR